jgi:hypothetical protein
MSTETTVRDIRIWKNLQSRKQLNKLGFDDCFSDPGHHFERFDELYLIAKLLLRKSGIEKRRKSHGERQTRWELRRSV